MITAPPSSTLFPYTTLFRSERRAHLVRGAPRRRHGDVHGLDHHRSAGERGHRALHRPAHVAAPPPGRQHRSEEHTSELQSHSDLVCRLLLEKKNKNTAARSA